MSNNLDEVEIIYKRIIEQTDIYTKLTILPLNLYHGDIVFKRNKNNIF